MRWTICFILIFSCITAITGFCQSNKMDSLLKALATDMDNATKVKTLYNIAKTQMAIGNSDSALHYSEKALSLANNNHLDKELINLLLLKGEIFLYQKKGDSAKVYFNKSLILSRQLKDTSAIIKSLENTFLVFENGKLYNSDSLMYYSKVIFDLLPTTDTSRLRYTGWRLLLLCG